MLFGNEMCRKASIYELITHSNRSKYTSLCCWFIAPCHNSTSNHTSNCQSVWTKWFFRIVDFLCTKSTAVEGMPRDWCDSLALSTDRRREQKKTRTWTNTEKKRNGTVMQIPNAMHCNYNWTISKCSLSYFCMHYAIRVNVWMYYHILYISGTNVTHKHTFNGWCGAFNVHNPKTSTNKSNYEPIYRKGLISTKSIMCAQNTYSTLRYFLHHIRFRLFLDSLSVYIERCETRNIVIPISSPKICVTLC